MHDIRFIYDKRLKRCKLCKFPGLIMDCTGIGDVICSNPGCRFHLTRYLLDDNGVTVSTHYSGKYHIRKSAAIKNWNTLQSEEPMHDYDPLSN